MLGRPYSAEVLSAAAEIRALEDYVRVVVPERDNSPMEPRFFLASLSEEWSPRVVVVRRAGAIAGIVYAKERRVGGLPTGIVFGDGRLGNLVVAEAVDREEVIVAALVTLFRRPRVRALRLAIPIGATEARAVARAQPMVPFDLGYAPASKFDAHASLRLPLDYEAFLARLGSRTRRNFRHYRRRFEDGGHAYLDDVPAQDLQQAARDLSTKCRIPSGRGEIARALSLLATTSRPWTVGLKSRDGAWLSVAAGWLTGARAVMFFQLNDDRNHEDASLSVVLRACLIETLIRRGIPELMFWSGCAAPLSRYVEPIPAMAAYLDTPALGWRLIRSMIGKTRPWMPGRMTVDMRWITGDGALALEPPEAPIVDGVAAEDAMFSSTRSNGER